MNGWPVDIQTPLYAKIVNAEFQHKLRKCSHGPEGKHKVHWLSWEKMVLPKKDGGLGFRDIHAFLAMLAKQGWRIIQNPDSLCAKIPKAKYFPNSSCLDAHPKEGISYTWRSILKGIDILKAVVIWRIGDGVGIDMWKDPWFPRDHTRRPVTPRRGNLMSHVATGDWNIQLVRDTFWEQDAKIILDLPLTSAWENSLAWHYDSRGLFSVRSAYKVCRRKFLSEQGRDGGASNSNSGHQQDDLWRLIWLRFRIRLSTSYVE
jgi:hypothetical protein